MAKNLKGHCMKVSNCASESFALRYHPNYSLCPMFRDLLEQAHKHQKGNLGIMYFDTVLHHLIGALLKLVLAGRNIEIEHHGASVADAPTARAGDFLIERV